MRIVDAPEKGNRNDVPLLMDIKNVLMSEVQNNGRIIIRYVCSKIRILMRKNCDNAEQYSM